MRELAARINAEVPRLDVLVNNAAVGFGAPGEGRQVSADGHELRFAVNYLAPVLLTTLLVPLLAASAPSRVLNVGSIGQIAFNPADAEFEHGYQGVEAYGTRPAGGLRPAVPRQAPRSDRPDAR